MAAVRVLVLLFCLSMVVEVESKVLDEEQSLTEIIDYDTQDTAVNLHPASKKENTKSIPSVLERKNSNPPILRKEQFSVEMVDESTQTKKTFSNENVKGNAMKSLGFLSKEEAALVDQDVNRILDYYGFREKNGPKLKENKKALRIREPKTKMREGTLVKNRVLNSVKKPNQALKDLNKKQKLPDKAGKPIFKFQTKKMPDRKLAKMINQNNSPNAKPNSKLGHQLQEQKNKFDLSQQKNIIHHSPLQENNGKLLTLKNNIVKDISVKNGHQSSWLPTRDNVKLFQDDKSQDSVEPNMPVNVTKAAQEYMKMPSKEILELVQDDVQVQQQNGSLGAQGRNGSKASRGGIDIAAPDWLPIKETIHGIQFDMIQDDENKMAHKMQGVQNNMASTQKHVRPNQISGVQNVTAAQENVRPSQVSGIQNDMAQKNGNSKIQNDLSGKQNNVWSPIRLNIQGLQFDKDSSNKTKMNMEMKNFDSLTADSMEVEGLNVTANSEFENIMRDDDNGTNKAKNLEDSIRNDTLQYGNITFKSTRQNSTVSNISDVENIHSSDQDKLNFTSLPNENSKSSFKQLKNEKDVTKQVWSPGKVINSHGHEILHMTSWTPWSTCSETCGTNGLQIRTRHCSHAQNDGLPCNGSTIDWKWCASVDVCPESGLHIVSHNNNSTYADVVIEGNNLPNQWGSWSSCSKRCGTKSLRIRTRNCSGQRSKDTGVCVEPTMQWTWCEPVPCGGPQHATMRFGYKKKGMPSASRTIPADNVNKASNPVIHTDNGIAFKDSCIVSPWSKWSKCSKSCGENSFKFRTRTCNCNYKQLCKSATLQREHCKLHPCEGEENYGPWTAFSSCTKSCGGGWKKRTRRCKKVEGHNFCDQDLLIGVKVCNTHKCQKASNGVYKNAMVANVNPKSMCGFNPCTEFGCMDNPDTKCLADTSCDPIFFNEFGHIDEKCRGWQRYEVRNPTLFCGSDPCFGSKCQRAFGRCSVDLNCKAFVLGADGTQIDCNMIQYPF